MQRFVLLELEALQVNLIRLADDQVLHQLVSVLTACVASHFYVSCSRHSGQDELPMLEVRLPVELVWHSCMAS
jgi:hypothetical protein